MNPASSPLAQTAPSAPSSRNHAGSGRASPRDGDHPFSTVLEQAREAPAATREEERKGKSKEGTDAPTPTAEPTATARPPEPAAAPASWPSTAPATPTVVAEATDSADPGEEGTDTTAQGVVSAPTTPRLPGSTTSAQAAGALSATPFSGALDPAGPAGTVNVATSPSHGAAAGSTSPTALTRNDAQTGTAPWVAPDAGTPSTAIGLASVQADSSSSVLAMAATKASAAEALTTGAELKLTTELGMQGLNIHTADETSASPVYRATLVSHPQQSAFPAELGTQVKFLMGSGLQQAELHLNPAELGPIRIQLNMVAQTADLSFTATHSATRESILQALPALRDMLAGQGLNLGQAGLSSGQGNPSFAQPGQHGPQRRVGARDDALAPVGAQGAGLSVQRTASQRMLDMYA